ncbi:hypothetical protein FG383_01220 [Psychrobacillus soli]|uniref:Uncharacterized protein n=1 Tax=Psychrobacillus soli TaxID=1543965 RepID=A0A544TMK3_9BACI|nr:hypothetical protein FG383_01220 [Psychrobacillus soli]
MEIRFGYVATAIGLWDASPSKNLTYARYSALTKSERMDKLMLKLIEEIASIRGVKRTSGGEVVW